MPPNPPNGPTPETNAAADAVKASQANPTTHADDTAAAGPEAKQPVWRRALAWCVALPGKAISAARTLSPSSLLGALLLIVLLAAFAPLGRVLQYVESHWQDIYFNPDREGLIVVDAPQLFTRERLINERLRESAWISSQLKAIEKDEALENFGKADSLALTHKMLSLLGSDTAGATPQAADGNGQDIQQISALLQSLGIASADPMAKFQDAQDFRERLSLKRYESILDDAHDIGSNTLHRLNFRLTITPARARSDSVAVVSIRIGEKKDARLLLDHYGRLVVETRKKMEETLDRMIRDRSEITRRDFELTTDEQVVISSLLKQKIETVFGQGTPDTHRVETRLLNYVIAQQAMAQEKIARDYLYDHVTKLGIPDLGAALFGDYPKTAPNFWFDPHNPDSFIHRAPKQLIRNCGRPSQLTLLAPEVFSATAPAYLNAQINYAKQLYAPPQGFEAIFQTQKAQAAQQGATGQQAPVQISAEGQKEPADSAESLPTNAKKSQSEAMRHAKQGFERLMATALNTECHNFQNATTIAKLRLIGRLELLERHVGAADLQDCLRDENGMGVKLASYIGQVKPPYTTREKLHDSCLTTLRASDDLMDFLRLNGGDYAQIGISLMLREKLSHLSLGTSTRQITLGSFFNFDISRCDLIYCKIQVRTKSEVLADDLTQFLKETPQPLTEEIAAQLQERRIALREAGREEALRLYMELSCFGRSRSYTVWPRSSERHAALRADQSGLGFARPGGGTGLTDMFGLRAEGQASTYSRDARDHIFGIGDWANKPTEVDGVAQQCGEGVDWLLDEVSIDGRFISQVKDLEAQDMATSKLQSWISGRFPKFYEIVCTKDACDIELEDIARRVQKRRNQHSDTQFSWIVIPQQDQKTGVSRHLPRSVPLSALISLPSWWGNAELSISTCWVRPGALKERLPQENLCDKDHSPQKIDLPLPAKAQDVLQRLGFFIIRTPYLDAASGDFEELEAGRPGTIRLTGSRLWKNPRVRVGSQWHDRLEVLPNMQGVVAEFDCVAPTIRPEKLTARLYHEELARYAEPQNSDAAKGMACTDETRTGGASYGQNGPPDPAGGAGRPTCTRGQPDVQGLYFEDRLAEVWTSEGRTSPTIVRVHAFRPRYFVNGELEKPCWISEVDKQKIDGG